MAYHRWQTPPTARNPARPPPKGACPPPVRPPLPLPQLFTATVAQIGAKHSRKSRVSVKRQLIPGGWSRSVKMGTLTAPRPCTRPWRGVGTRRAVESIGSLPAIMPDVPSAGHPIFRSVSSSHLGTSRARSDAASLASPAGRTTPLPPGSLWKFLSSSDVRPSEGEHPNGSSFSTGEGTCDHGRGGGGTSRVP